jgi:hypothetical protein
MKRVFEILFFPFVLINHLYTFDLFYFFTCVGANAIKGAMGYKVKVLSNDYI